MSGQDGSGVGAPDPFSLPYGGYDDVLADADPGLWWQMLRPGARGHGLLVAFHMPHLCCHTPNAIMASTDIDDVPVLLPVPVTWASGLREDGTVSRALDRDWKDERPYGPICLTAGVWPDETFWSPMRVVNALMPDESEYDETGWWLDDLGIHTQGVVSPWQLVPLTEQAWEAACRWTHAADGRLHLYGLSESNCSRSDWDEVGHEDECVWKWPDETCSCGIAPVVGDVAEQLDEAMFYQKLRGDQLVPPWLADAWHLAQMHYIRGHGLIHDRLPVDREALSRGQGDPWSISYWRRLSPFSGSGSLELLRRRLSQDSTSSQMPLVS